MRRLAVAANGTVLISAHPSLTGINTGTGLSGSTAWHNSVRARAYMHTVKTAAGEEPDPDLRELEFKKNQYDRKAERVLLRWKNGVFVPEPKPGSLETRAREQRADELFLSLLDRWNDQNRTVSDKKTSNNYAPTAFANEPEAKDAKIDKKDLADAMTRLFAADQLRCEPYGPPSTPHSKIVRKR